MLMQPDYNNSLRYWEIGQFEALDTSREAFNFSARWPEVHCQRRFPYHFHRLVVESFAPAWSFSPPSVSASLAFSSSYRLSPPEFCSVL